MYRLLPGGPFSVLLFLLCCLPAFRAAAQLKADFTIDKPGGCAPHAVVFTNKTTGGSAATVYSWQFGNGNTSSLTNPGATYNDEKVYTVTLKATDGAQTSTKTLQVTVYKKPTVDFSANTTKGCAPLAISLTSNSTAGDGSISNYFWDFGDGGLEQGAQLKTISHTYSNVQQASVSLTVTNSFGCYQTLEKPAFIDIMPAISASFSAPSAVCKETDAIPFINTSTGPGTLEYSWDMGDGTKLTDKNPSYTYNKKGVYPVRLKVKNEHGCEATSNIASVNVANFSSDFDIPPTVCSNNAITFTNKSTPAPVSSLWMADDGTSGYSYGNGPVTLNFRQAGTRKLTLTNQFGNCSQSVTKDVVVKAPPVLNGFIADANGACGSPVTYKFKDSSAGAVKWQWNFDMYYSNATSSLKEPSYTYTADRHYTIGLTVTNADGCTAFTSKYMEIYKPNVGIGLSYGSSSGCVGLRVIFNAYSNDEITSYKWNLGDGTNSTDKNPEHTYNKEGVFNVVLTYETRGGCKGSANYYITVYKKPEADFTVANTTICGNTPVMFTDKTTGTVTYWQWNFGDNSYYGDNTRNPVHQYNEEGEYSVRLIATNGNCSDTITRENYIKVLPGFPDITGYSNTCENTREEVTFSQASRQAFSWTWDFGDGSSPVSLTTDQPTIRHTYTKTGSFKTVLTITNGTCSVKDSIINYVLLKQSPKLSANAAEVCSSNLLEIKVSGMENNPLPANWSYGSHYIISQLQYGDGSRYNGYDQSPSTNWTTTYNGKYGSLETGKENLRVILQSHSFGCYDTTNLLLLKIRGPIADFSIDKATVCFRDSASFTDLSVAQNGVAIRKWEWSFGDGQTLSTATGKTVKHLYTNPQGYYVQLKVTDAEGCSATTPAYTKMVSVNGPRADFYYSPDRILPQSTVYFYNNSNTYPYSYYIQYRWQFSDGTTGTDYYSSKYYPKVGTDTVTLSVKDPQTGCSDSITKVIYIKDVTAAFTYTTSYINNNSCPPVVARFTNTSDNYQSISWDFGNGKSAGNINNASSTYDHPGIYIVTLVAQGLNGATDTLRVPIEVKGPYAILSADTLSGCTSQTVTLSAVVRNASSFTWDFGDGTLLNTTDTFAVHSYATAGIYQPALIMKDGTGCAGTSRIPEKIVIDALTLKIGADPALVCDSGLVQFTPQVESLAADQLQLPLQYEWTSGNDQFSDAASPVFYFNQPGDYEAALTVTSPFGCVQSARTPVKVVRKTHATVAGPAAICADAAALFAATADSTGALVWSWNFGNGVNAGVQDPPAVVYPTAGNYTVQTILQHNGCADTVSTALTVHPRPVVNLQPRDPVLCLGSSVQLAAEGGGEYIWSPAAGLSSSSIANPLAAPEFSTGYAVQVTNTFGCTSRDSTFVTVARPFSLQAPADTFVCRGLSVSLPVSGADSYAWISGDGLSSTTSDQPRATPAGTTLYTVVGYDAYQCFTDTAQVQVVVRDLPTVDAGADISMPTGEKVQLRPTASNDVVQWNWSPGLYMDCYNCPSPLVTPRDHTNYTVTVRNQYGCTASDAISIRLVCAENVSIPNAFTPNTDGRNDLFNILGRGIRAVKQLRIYSRMGDVVFEKSNFNIGDRKGGWDGYINGHPAPAGTYVYFVELICDSGELFTRKGTLVVVR